MEIMFRDGFAARCKFSSNNQCLYNELKPLMHSEPSGQVTEEAMTLCGPKKKIDLPQAGFSNYWENVATNQIQGCNKYQPSEGYAVIISGTRNELADKDSINRLCKYNPDTGTNCTYKSAFRYSLPPTGSHYSNGSYLCEPKLIILKAEGHQPLEKLEATGYEINCKVAAAQQRGCERFQPGKPALVVQGEFIAPEPINVWPLPVFVKTPEVKPTISPFQQEQNERFAYISEREGIIGELFKGNVKTTDLKEDTEITGLTEIKDLDALITKLVFEEAARLGLPPKEEPISNAADIKSFLAKQGFIGTLKEISPRIIVRNSNQNPDPGTKLFQILVEAGLFVSGKGRIDTYLGTTNIALSRANKPKVIALYKHLTKKDGLTDLALMLDTSAVTYEEEYRRRLEQVVSAGLPGLGKRR